MGESSEGPTSPVEVIQQAKREIPHHKEKNRKEANQEKTAKKKKD